MVSDGDGESEMTARVTPSLASHTRHAFLNAYLSLLGCRVFLSYFFIFALISFEILCSFDALRRLSFVTMVNGSWELRTKLWKVEMRALANEMNAHGTKEKKSNGRSEKGGGW